MDKPTTNPTGAEPGVDETAARQRALYDRIGEQYRAHYGDKWSLLYRERFTTSLMFRGIDLSGKMVLDACCGGGETTAFLLPRGARVTGLDISSDAVNAFAAKYPEAKGICASIFETGLPDGAFDIVSCFGGLHHLHPRVTDALQEIHRVLKPGGSFCFCEPHTGSFPDLARRLWYKLDRAVFETNEAAIDHRALLRAFQGRFESRFEHFGGNLAYLFVFNSMALRVPLGLKKLLSPPALVVERLLTPIQGRATSCFVVGQWTKTA